MKKTALLMIIVYMLNFVFLFPKSNSEKIKNAKMKKVINALSPQLKKKFISELTALKLLENKISKKQFNSRLEKIVNRYFKKHKDKMKKMPKRRGFVKDAIDVSKTLLHAAYWILWGCNKEKEKNMYNGYATPHAICGGRG